MKKITLYKKGGKLYYKKGGKMCLYEGGGPLRYRKPPVAQNGLDIKLNDNPSFSSEYSQNPYKPTFSDPGDVGYDSEGMSGKRDGKGFQVSDVGNYANIASGLMSMVPKTQQTFGDNKFARNALQGQLKKRDEVQKTQKDISAAVPVWGAVSNATRGFGEMIAPEDDYGIKNKAGKFFQTAFNPSSLISENATSSGTAGDKLMNIVTMGIWEESRKEKLRDMALAEQKQRDERAGQFNQNVEGVTGTNFFSKLGGDLRVLPYNTLNMKHKPKYTAEIEDGELMIGPDIGSVLHGGNSSASMVSEFAAKFNGDKHGQDTDGDGQEGIPVVAKEGMYVASNYLGLNGKKAKKGQKTVAQEMEPIVESLAKAEEGGDAFDSNKQLVKHQLLELENMKNEAEANKAIEELKSMLSKKDRDMDEIAMFIQENGQYLGLGETQSQEAIPQMQQGQMQAGGKIIGDIEKYAQEKGVSPQAIQAAQQVDASKFDFADPETYTGSTGNTYDVDSDIQSNLNTEEAERNINVAPTTKVVDERQGVTEGETTLGQQAGKSDYTGTSLLIQEKMEEVLDKDLFSPSGGLSEEWIKKGMEEGLSYEDLTSAKRSSITEGDVGKWLGKEMQRAFGVQSVGKDTQSRNVDSQVSGKTSALYNNEKLNWVDDIRKDIIDNNNIVPAKYADLPEDLLNEVTRLARTGKQAHEGKFGTSLTDAFTKANESVTDEVARVESYGYDTESQSGEKIDRNTDLAKSQQAGNIDSFSAAFRYARNSPELADEPFFTYKGKQYSKKTRSEDPELAKVSDSAALENKNKTKPTTTIDIKPQEREMKANNPKSRLKRLIAKKFGGMTSYQQGGLVNVMDEMARQKAMKLYLAGRHDELSPDDMKFLQGKGFTNVGQTPTTPTIQTPTQPTIQTRNEQPWADFVSGNIKQAQVADKEAENAAFRQSRGLAPRFGDRPVGRTGAVEEAQRTSGITQPFQEGGMMGEEQEQPMGPGAESNEHMQQLMAQGEGQDPNAAQPVEDQMQQPVPQPIAALAPQAQEAFMMLPPEMQEQILQLPPEQMEIAIMNAVQQMQQQGQQPAPQGQPQMAQGQSPIPPEVMQQLG